MAKLRLHNNQLPGTIPVELGKLEEPTQLLLGGNWLPGELPISIIQLKARGCSVTFHEIQMGHHFPKEWKHQVTSQSETSPIGRSQAASQAALDTCANW